MWYGASNTAFDTSVFSSAFGMMFDTESCVWSYKGLGVKHCCVWSS